MNNLNFEIRKFAHPPFFFTDSRKVFNYEETLAKLPKNTFVVIREYDLQNNLRLDFAQKIKKLAQARSLKILVGKDFSLAQNINANGVHFSDYDKLPFSLLKKNRRKDFIFSLACHSLKSVLRAQKLKPSIIFISPIFPTTSHPKQKNIGIRNLAKIIQTQQSKKPIIAALGGINLENLKMLRKLKIKSFGAIDLFNQNTK